MCSYKGGPQMTHDVQKGGSTSLQLQKQPEEFGLLM